MKSGVSDILGYMIFCTHWVQIHAEIFAKKAVFISLSALFYNLNFTDSGIN